MYSKVLSELVITKVYSVSTFFTPQNMKVRKRDRRRWAIVIKYEGETVYTAKGKQVVSNINHPVILPKGCSYQWHCTKTGHFSIIEFACDASFDEPMGFSIKNPERVLKLFQELEHKQNLQKPLYELESIRDAYTILLQLAHDSAEGYVSGDKREKLSAAITYISQNYGEHITNDTLAQICGMSTVYFRKLFTQVMGVSPITYTKQFRIEKAKQMLRSDYGTISYVAQSLGYSSLYDFSRDFKKHTGVSPSKFEK